MQYSDDRHHFRFELDPKQCQVPPDELASMQDRLTFFGEAVGDFPASDLSITIIHHPQNHTYHVECRLRLPGRTLFTGDWDEHIYPAFDRCIRKLLQKVATYREHPDQPALDQAERRTALDRDVVAPEEPDVGPIGDAVQAGDYKAFRIRLAGYEEWLRDRVGRWVQRYPEAEARIGNGLAIGDVVEEVFLNAFERYPQRPAEVPLHDWLDRLIDPSLKALLSHLPEEQDNISRSRTLLETPLEPNE